MADDPNAEPGDTGNGAPTDNGTGDDAPQYITADEFDKKLNQAITGHFRRFESKSQAQQDALIEKLAARLQPTPSSNDDDDDDDADPPNGADGDDKPDVAALKEMERKFQKARKKDLERINALERERDQERTRLKEAKREGAMRDALSGAGVQADRIKHAMAYLGERVRYDETGELRFYDEAGDDHSLTEGLSQWVNSPDGKLYLPARAPSGSGDGPNRGSGAGRGNESAVEKLNRKLGNALANRRG